jgi:hypothetical protein
VVSTQSTTRYGYGIFFFFFFFLCMVMYSYISDEIYYMLRQVTHSYS